MERSARFSPCRSFRYSLWRNWRGLLPPATGYAMFIGLNPSTADEENDDPTVRRCMAYAKAWGFEGLCMTNLFAYRATDPAVMLAHPSPIGEENDHTLIQLAKTAGIVIAAWGAHGAHLGRGKAVAQLIPHLHCLRLIKDGHPGHPLYLPKTLKPTPYLPNTTTQFGQQSSGGDSDARTIHLL